MSISTEQRRARNELRRKEGIEYLGGKCVRCNSTKDLQIDHKDPSTKDAKLKPWRKGMDWEWSWERRKKELDKCQLLCEPCHRAKTTENKEHRRGEESGRAKLTDDMVREIRTKYATGNYSHRVLAKEYGISKRPIAMILNGESWQHVL